MKCYKLWQLLHIRAHKLEHMTRSVSPFSWRVRQQVGHCIHKAMQGNASKAHNSGITLKHGSHFALAATTSSNQDHWTHWAGRHRDAPANQAHTTPCTATRHGHTIRNAHLSASCSHPDMVWMEHNRHGQSQSHSNMQAHALTNKGTHVEGGIHQAHTHCWGPRNGSIAP